MKKKLCYLLSTCFLSSPLWAMETSWTPFGPEKAERLKGKTLTVTYKKSSSDIPASFEPEANDLKMGDIQCLRITNGTNPSEQADASGEQVKRSFSYPSLMAVDMDGWAFRDLVPLFQRLAQPAEGEYQPITLFRIKGQILNSKEWAALAKLPLKTLILEDASIAHLDSSAIFLTLQELFFNFNTFNTSAKNSFSSLAQNFPALSTLKIKGLGIFSSFVQVLPNLPQSLKHVVVQDQLIRTAADVVSPLGRLASNDWTISNLPQLQRFHIKGGQSAFSFFYTPEGSARFIFEGIQTNAESAALQHLGESYRHFFTGFNGPQLLFKNCEFDQTVFGENTYDFLGTNTHFFNTKDYFEGASLNEAVERITNAPHETQETLFSEADFQAKFLLWEGRKISSAKGLRAADFFSPQEIEDRSTILAQALSQPPLAKPSTPLAKIDHVAEIKNVLSQKAAAEGWSDPADHTEELAQFLSDHRF